MMGAPINDEGKRIYGDACLPWAMDVTYTSLDEHTPSLLRTTKTTVQKLKRCSWKTILLCSMFGELVSGFNVLFK